MGGGYNSGPTPYGINRLPGAYGGGYPPMGGYGGGGMMNPGMMGLDLS